VRHQGHQEPVGNGTPAEGDAVIPASSCSTKEEPAGSSFHWSINWHDKSCARMLLSGQKMQGG
jgi:hypothetical protein